MQFHQLKRRDFITLLGGALVARPVAAHAQGPNRILRVGALMPEPESYPESRARMTAFEQALSKLGWTVGQNLMIDYRWEISNFDRGRTATTELLALVPDAILAVATPATLAAKAATGTIPIVFVAVSEPVAQGIVASLAHPGGNLTGFTNLEATFGAKWLELLKEIAPQVTRVATIFNPDAAPNMIPFARSIEVAAPQFAVGVATAHVHGPAEIEAAITKLAGEPQGGFILIPDPYTAGHRKLIVDLAMRHRLPAIYGLKYFAAEDGLAFYGIDIIDLFKKAAVYVDRILKGAKPADLPAQQPTQFQLVINLRAARRIGLDVPPTLLARADEVIE
jgi:ABC-type uncharacterized transport system substrate-binding protein